MSNVSTTDRVGNAAGAARDATADVASQAKEQAGAVVGRAKEEAADVVAEARGQAQRVVQTSREQLHRQANEQTQRLAGTLIDVSDQLNGMAQGQWPAQGIVLDASRQIADVTGRLGRHLESTSPEQLLDDVRSFARRRPGAFFLGAVGAGFLVGRLVRALDTSAVVDAAKGSSDGNGNGAGGVGMGAGSATEPAALVPPVPATAPIPVAPSTTGLVAGDAP